jgi:amidophosphoribosyltransferase
MSELFHECGIVAVYHYNTASPSQILGEELPPGEASRLIPRMLLDIQNRGQLAAGMTAYRPTQTNLLATHKDLGPVSEAFRMSHQAKYDAIMSSVVGPAAIGHVRYATCGKDDINYAQPFVRPHLEKRKWFSFAFNGQLANYIDLRQEVLSTAEHHLALESDTELVMHYLSQQFSGDRRPTLFEAMAGAAKRFDGAYSIVFLNANGEMLVARDPLGMKPLCYADDGKLFAAASESVALLNLGFSKDDIRFLGAGEAIVVTEKGKTIERFAPAARTAHCFFEWIYFANVASSLDNRSVYQSRYALGLELARLELERPDSVPIDEDVIVVPVPDTSKAAADAMAFKLGVPCREGLMRNRYSGRTFIEGPEGRIKKVKSKYTPLREVLEDKVVLLVEDSIVRSTTLSVLVDRIKEIGRAREVHVRVACPPIVAPCYYGIDMSRIRELFAPRFMEGNELTPEIEAQMARKLNADSLRYLPVESIARAIGLPSHSLCQACITGRYPTSCGQELYELDLGAKEVSPENKRLFDVEEKEVPRELLEASAPRT